MGDSASTSVLPMNIQDWFPLGWPGLISLLYTGLSRVFSSTTIQKKNNDILVTVGEYDDPANQRQGVVNLSLTRDGNVAIFGNAESGKESTCNEGDLGSIPVLGRSPGEG